MTPFQAFLLLFSPTFLALGAAYVIALSFLIPKQQPVRVKKQRRPE